LLNVIALRLKKSPKSKIAISGMTDGTELPNLEARMKLAGERAKTVAKYFTENWEIPSKQIKTETREIPELATSNSYPEGFEENRRVEIYSDDPEILKPVIHTKFKENQFLTEEIEFLYTSNSLDSISNWNLALGGVVIQKSETMQSNKLNYRITPELKEKIMSMIHNSEPLILDFNCDVFGKKEVRKFPLQLEKEQNSFELQRLNLIVFDFDKYELNEMNKNMISNFVTHSIQDNSAVRIIGSTDRLGEKEYNMQLSKERANTAFRYLKDLKPKANFVEVKGIGDSSLLHNNNIPEGRFYCRTLLIEVKTPIIK
jgi:outer membrane protein OmpA-like peptidoglycan-associated protein